MLSTLGRYLPFFIARFLQTADSLGFRLSEELEQFQQVDQSGSGAPLSSESPVTPARSGLVGQSSPVPPKRHARGPTPAVTQAS